MKEGRTLRVREGKAEVEVEHRQRIADGAEDDFKRTKS
jgi:hypothetical protein